MQIQYFKEYSPALGRDMECKVYGHAGRPVLFIPCQDGRFNDFEGFHLDGVFAPWIDSGQLMVCSVDTLDAETWSAKSGDPYWRIRRHEQWMAYLSQELVPGLRAMARDYNHWDGDPGVMAFGCSLGATHAVNLYFRYPYLFDSLLALSGIYTAQYGFGDYMDELVYLNSPVHYLAGLAPDHPYLEAYRQHRGVVCVGQGPWEVPETTIRLRDICQEKGIPLWVDLWGTDVAHDWPWWYKQIPYFLPKLLE